MEFYFYRGRAAMYSLLRAMKIQPGDEVIVQAYTCLAVPLPVMAVGAKPVYADVNQNSYTANPEKIRALITPRTRVIVVQHTYGIPAQLNELMAIARENGIAVLEDCCHVCGGVYAERPLGSFGAGAFYSYQWSKPVVIGRGGRAVVNDRALFEPMNEIYRDCFEPPLLETAAVNLEYLAYAALRGKPLLERLRAMVRAAVPSATGTFKRDELSFKATRDYRSKMAPSLARRLRSKLREAEAAIEKRRSITTRYHERLTALGASGLSLANPADAVLMSYPLLFKDKAAGAEVARRRGIQVDTSFASPVEPLTSSEDWASVGYRAGSCSNAEFLAAHTLTFPIRDWVSEEHIQRVLAFVSEMVARGSITRFLPS